MAKVDWSALTNAALFKGETRDVEFKRSPESIDAEDLIAMANTVHGGSIIAGVRDPKQTTSRRPEIVGCDIDDLTKQRIANKAASCIPPVHIVIEDETDGTTTLLRIVVPPSSTRPHCTSSGTYKVRGPSGIIPAAPVALLEMMLEREADSFAKRFKQSVAELENRLQAVLATVTEFNTAMAEELGDLRRERADRVMLETCPAYLKGRSLDVVRLAMERPRFWEYLLFARVLRDGIHANRMLRRDLDTGLRLGQLLGLSSARDLAGHAEVAMTQLINIVQGCTSLMNERSPEAFGPPGVAGDAEAIVHLTSRIAEAHRLAIEWAMRWRMLHVPANLSAITSLGEKFVTQFLYRLEEFADRCFNEISQACLSASSPGPPIEIELSLLIEAPAELDAFYDLLRSAVESELKNV